jgi:hypothetical protein
MASGRSQVTVNTTRSLGCASPKLHQQVPRRSRERERCAQLLADPRRRRAGCHVYVRDLATTVLDDEEDVEEPQGQRRERKRKGTPRLTKGGCFYYNRSSGLDEESSKRSWFENTTRHHRGQQGGQFPATQGGSSGSPAETERQLRLMLLLDWSTGAR